MMNRVGSGRRPTTPARALLSTLVLLLISLAVPVVLVIVGGSPVPRGGLGRLWSLLHHGQAFDASLVTSWVLHGALFLAWVTWAWMLICVVVELISWLTGRTPARLPGSRTLQAATACLVGTSLAVLAMGRTLPMPAVHASPAVARTEYGNRPPLTGGAQRLRVLEDYRFGSIEGSLTATAAGVGISDELPAASGELLVGQSTPADVRRSSSPLTGGTDGLSGSLPVDPDFNQVSSDPIVGPAAGAGDVHSVLRRETLWSIAQDRLGDARRWREIAELNYSVVQPDGQTLTGDNWVAPGWRLRLPTSAGATPTPTTVNEDARPTVVAQDVTTPGQPPISHQESEVHARSSKSGSRRLVSDVLDSYAGRGRGQSDSLIASAGDRMPLELLGAGLLGAGVVGLLERLRRTQQRHRKDGEFIAMPDRRGIQVEQRLRHRDGRCDIDALDNAVRGYLESSSHDGLTPPVIRGIQLHPEQIELRVQFGQVVDQVEMSGRSEITSVFLDLSHGPRVDRSTDRSPCPTLVTVGSNSTGPLLLNLAALGSLALVGDESACEGVVRVLALELATSPWASQFDLVLVGFGEELNRFERVRTVADRAALIDQLHRRRLIGAGAPIGPMVVVCAPALASEDVIELVTAGSDPSTGTVVVACGEGFWSEYRLPISSGDGSSVLEPLGAVIYPNRISTTDLDGVCALVDAALDRRSVALDDAPYSALTIPLPEYRSRTDAEALAGSGFDEGAPSAPGGIAEEVSELPTDPIEIKPAVRVCVLGPVEIQGAARPFSRAWSKELVVYLAMHSHGATNDAWATALWPDRLMASSSLHSTASVARRSLGQGPDGRDHLPRAHGRLALAESVDTDWSEFVRLAQTNDVGHMRMAMDLIRGRPFEGLRASDWPILEGVAPAIEAAAVDLAGRLAGLYLRRGDAAGAEWSARKGLLVSPYDERLYRMLLRAADRAGNPAGVESVMSELIRLVADEVEPFDSVHPSTMDLYRSLSRRKALTTSFR
jgi:DNA-binding SARP family transcriptional activator